MSASEVKTLACGCQVKTSRDFLDRVVGTVTARGPGCTNAEHAEGAVVLIPGREHARRE